MRIAEGWRGGMVALALLALATEAYAAQRGVVTAIALSPQKTRTGNDVTVTVTGRNPCGAVFIDWADGTALTYPLHQLPAAQTHKYDKPGQYTVVARGMGNCDGETSAILRIDPGPAPAPPPPPAPAPPTPGGRLTTMEITPNPGVLASAVTISIAGKGRCSYLLDYGDGNNERKTGSLPDRWPHVYNAAATYVVKATADPPCEGVIEQKLTVRREVRGVTRLVVAPEVATTQSRVTITIEGRGTCPLTVDFGDGLDQLIESALPARITHTYTRPGQYEIYAWADGTCTGDASAVVTVRRPR